MGRGHVQKVDPPVGDLEKYSDERFLLRDVLFPALFYVGHYRIEILVKPLPALFGIIPAAVGVALG